MTSETFREAAISMGIPADVFDRARELSRSGMDPIAAMEQATREAEGGQGAQDNPCRRCGHARRVHVHYRRGLDCDLCGCPRFRQWWGR